MRQDLHTILKLNTISPRLDLESDIIQTVFRKNARNITIKFWTSVTVGVASIIGIVPAVRAMASALTQSGFYEYLTLLFSNGGMLSRYSSDLVIALGESVPGVSITIFLFVFVVLLWSLQNIFKQSTSPYFKLSIN